eukprot:scaffold65166_cov63-Phaeocystis_antarctica.AAC.1
MLTRLRPLLGYRCRGADPAAVTVASAVLHASTVTLTLTPTPTPTLPVASAVLRASVADRGPHL